MRSFARTTMLLALMVLALGSAASAEVSIGITIGAPPPPRVVYSQPRRPNSDAVWVAGYWYPVARKYTWHNGYWTNPPYAGASWVAPHHDGKQYFVGYWEGNQGRIEHDHKTDRHKSRDGRS
jgi:hypothetical protein